MKVIHRFRKDHHVEKLLCQMTAGIIFIAMLSLLSACQSDAAISSEEGNASESAFDTEVQSMQALPEEPLSSSDYIYEEFEDGTLRLVAYQPETPCLQGAVLEVPAELDGKKVTVIGEGCFADKEAFERGVPGVVISLPEGITTIEDHILNRWVRKLEVPDSVMEIAEEAFYWLYQESEWQALNDIIIGCSRASLAEQYARDRKLRYIYPDDNWRKDEAFLELQDRKGYQYFEQYRIEGTLTDFIVIEYWDNEASSSWWLYDLVVLDKSSGEEVQRLQQKDAEFPYHGYYGRNLIDEGDADFDGEPELLLFQDTIGNQEAAIYRCYHWDEVQRQYVEYESFCGIHNPYIDEEDQVIRGFSRGSATTHYESIYVFRNGEFILVEEKEVIFTEEGNEL